MLPPAYLLAVRDALAAAGRDFDAEPLQDPAETGRIESLRLVGYTADQVAGALRGGLIQLRPWEMQETESGGVA